MATASSGVMPRSPTQSLAEMRTEIGLRRRPHGAHGVKDLQRKAHAVLERAAVGVACDGW